MSTKICAYCGKEFRVKPYRREKAKYCSVECHNKAQKGKISWNKDLTGEEYKSHFKNGFKGIFKKGHIPINPIKKGEHKGLEFKKGEHPSIKTEFKKGHIPWIKDKHHSEETKEIISRKGKGRGLGKERSFEVKTKIGESQKGEKNHNWKGGITPLRSFIRKCFEYNQWRSDIFTRDRFTCQDCGQIGGRLNAHHIKTIKSLTQYYEITTKEEVLECKEIFNIDNGITLCRKCHINIHRNKKILGGVCNV